MIYSVNATVVLNVSTTVDTDDPRIRDSDAAVRRQAMRQLHAGNYEAGDMQSEPVINFVEPEDMELR